MAIVRWALVVLTALAAIGSWWSFARADDHAEHAAKYQCPMHPQIVSEHPGECPICGMALEPIAKNRQQPAPAAAAPAGSLQPPPGTAPVMLTLNRQQLIGVRTSLAKPSSASPRLRVTAAVESPEQSAAEVHVRTPGFVERIRVKETGVSVRAGQELLGVYSPELFQAQSELIAASRWGNDGAQALAAARRKLELLGVPAATSTKLIEKGVPSRTISIVAPSSGVVVKKNVVLGSYVTPETVLYEIVDLRRVYVVADVFQSDVDKLSVGSAGRFVTGARADAPIVVKVDLIYPRIEAQARTTRVRMQIDNAKLALLPGQYGHVEFDVPGSSTVLVPRDALIDTGRHQYVFVDRGGGTFEARSVEVARERDQELELQSGLTAGERVVSGATFLIDSESRLQAALLEQAAP
jgi:Cu(I)/Ag(I) efflux system membrane fusion protein